MNNGESRSEVKVNRTVLALVGLTMLRVFATGPAQADTLKSYQSGSWHYSYNWRNSSVYPDIPSSADSVWIGNSDYGYSYQTDHIDLYQGTGYADYVFISPDSSGSYGSLDILNSGAAYRGNLTVDFDVDVGVEKDGQLYVTGYDAHLSVGDDLRAGIESGASGTITARYGATVTANQLMLGYGNHDLGNGSGSGTLNLQYSGTSAATNNMYLGLDRGFSGTVNVGGGTTFRVNYASSPTYLRESFVGYYGSGTVNVNGGTWESNNLYTYVGYDRYDSYGAGSRGTVNINSGTWDNSYYTHVGYKYGSVGIVNVNGGTWDAGLYPVRMAYYSGSRGYINLNDGGTMKVGSLHGGPGYEYFYWDGGTLQNSVGHDLYVSSSVSSMYLKTSGQNTLRIDSGRSGDIYATIRDYSSSSPGSLVKAGDGTATLHASNTYTGTTIVNGGVLRLGANERLHNSSDLTVNAGTFNLQGYSETVDVVTLTGGAITNGDLSAHAFNVESGSISANLHDASSAALTKTTGGTVTLSGNNSYSGGTTVSDGTLIAAHANALGSGDITIGGSGEIVMGAGIVLDLQGVTLGNDGTFTGNIDVSNGGTIKGNGTFGELNVADGGILAPGNSTGNLTAGATTFGPGGVLQWEVNDFAGTAGSTSLGWDLLSITGMLSITATALNPFDIDIISLTASQASGEALNFDNTQCYSLMFITTTAGIDNFDAEFFNLDTSSFWNDLGGGRFSVSQVGNDLYVNFTPAPEPASLAVWGLLGVLGIAVHRWRRRG